MIIKDVMPAFELYQPTQLKDAFALLDRFGKDGWKMAGRLRQPVVVQGTHQAAEGGDRPLGGIAELKGIRETADGIEIGALTTLTEIERNPIVRGEVPPARRRGRPGGEPADPQRRHDRRQRLPGRALPATTATACPAIAPAARTCFADTPEGVNREHALFDIDRCVAVSPSDTAPALVALDAKFVIQQLARASASSAPRTSSSARTSTSPT